MPLHRLTSTALTGLLSLVMLLLAAPSLAQEAGADSDPAYGTLADLIEDDASRNALIEELRALQAARAITDATLVCKRGALGCVVFEGGITGWDDGVSSPVREIEVFNVLGAGDGFMSGFLSVSYTHLTLPTKA